MPTTCKKIHVNVYKHLEDGYEDTVSYISTESFSVIVDQAVLSNYSEFRNKLAQVWTQLANNDIFVRIIEDYPQEQAAVISSSAELGEYFQKQKNNQVPSIGLLIYEQTQLQRVMFIGVDESTFYPRQTSLQSKSNSSVAQQYIKVYVKRSQLRRFLVEYYQLLND